MFLKHLARLTACARAGTQYVGACFIPSVWIHSLQVAPMFGLHVKEIVRLCDLVDSRRMYTLSLTRSNIWIR